MAVRNSALPHATNPASSSVVSAQQQVQIRARQLAQQKAQGIALQKVQDLAVAKARGAAAEKALDVAREKAIHGFDAGKQAQVRTLIAENQQKVKQTLRPVWAAAGPSAL